ncbi:MAG: 5'-nucleotidase C-terminal domain-containing protein [Eubacteriales bacterium]|nr:5'-nucleotidase C-terminal domain-containing protein [Eubacteriales bacterium]
MKKLFTAFLALIMVLALLPVMTTSGLPDYTREDAAVFLAEKFALADIHASAIEGSETTPKNLGYTASAGAIVTKNVIAAAKDCVELESAPKIEAVINAQLMGLAADGLSFEPNEPITVSQMATAVAKGMFGADLSIDHLQTAIDAGLFTAEAITDEPITAEQIPTLFGFLDNIEIVALFATSDIHGNYLPYTSSDSAFTIGSVARIKTIMDEVTAMVGADNVIYVDGGDSPYNTTLANVTNGNVSVACLNALGLDATVIGNHDFDYSFENLLRLRDDATYNMLSCNVKFKSDKIYEGETLYPFDGYTLIQAGGITFGIFGVTDDNSAATTLYSNTVDIEFDDDLTKAAAVVDELDPQADVIVALSHVHSKNAALVTNNPEIDISIGGGNDIAGRPTILGEDQYLINPGKHGEALNQINVVIYNGEMTGIVYNQVFLTDAYAEDPAVKAIVDEYNGQVNTAMDEVAGYNAANLDWSSQLVRAQNSPIANLCTDALRAYFVDDEGNLPDVCFVNGGGIRAKLDEGAVTLRQLNAVLPFDNNMMLVETSGATILAALNNGVKSLPGLNGSFLQPSGLTYKVDISKPIGQRVAAEDVLIGGETLDLAAKYTVVINSFLAGGGDGYTMFNVLNTENVMATDCTQLVYVNQTYMRHALEQYIRTSTAENPIVADTTSRIEIIAGDTLTVDFMATTDMHGRAAQYDVATTNEDVNSMVRVASVVAANKTTYLGETLIVDNGDTFQGNLLAQYAATIKTAEVNPMTTAMTTIGYDAFVMGNHEFNYLPTVRDTQMNLLEDAGIDVLAANLTLVEDGKNFAGQDVEAGDTFYKPYMLKTFTNTNGQSATIAVIGITNANCDGWDSTQNFPNLKFYSDGNTDRKLEVEIQKWVDYIEENEDVDLIIVSAHSGYGSSSLESQIVSGVQNSSGVALVSGGHDHGARTTTLQNKNDETVYVINGGGSNVANAVIEFTFDAAGEVAGYTINTSNIPLSTATVNKALADAMTPWYNDARTWASQPRGTFGEGWNEVADEATGKTDTQMTFSQTHLMDLIHKAQIWATWQSESLGIKGATVSIASPVFGKTSGKLSYIPADGDTVSLLDVSRLYRYSNNLLVAVDMTGEQLYAWMSKVADMYTYNTETGNMGINSSIYGVDTFYGVDYHIDLSHPAGSRLVYAKYEGVDLRDYEGTIRVALNSYRIGGSYGFFEATGLDGDDCVWTAAAYLGDERAPVPTLICDYIEYMESVTPDDAPFAGTDSTWSATYDLLKGDANNDNEITAADAARILRWIVHIDGDRLLDFVNAEVDGVTGITAADAARILRWIVYIETTLG